MLIKLLPVIFIDQCLAQPFSSIIWEHIQISRAMLYAKSECPWDIQHLLEIPNEILPHGTQGTPGKWRQKKV